MSNQGKFYGITPPGSLVVGKFENDVVRQVFALKQAEQITLLQMGIAREPQKNFLGGFFEEGFYFRARRNGGGQLSPLL